MTTFTALYNMAGYLPEMEPQHFDTLADACDFIMDEMDRAADDCSDYHTAQKWANLNVTFARIKHGTASFDDHAAFYAPDGYYYCIDTNYDEMAHELMPIE